PRQDTYAGQSRTMEGQHAGRDSGSDRHVTRKVAAAEHNSVEALRDLVQKGQMYETGLGMPKNLNRAFDLYCEAAREGYPDALLRMGWMFAEGTGVEQNHSAASTLFKRAHRFGSAVGAELAERFPGKKELLPVCLKGTLVEKGTAERPPTTAELSAMAPRFDSPLAMRSGPLTAQRSR